MEGTYRAASLALIRWGGAGAILAGALFAAWGYLHRDAAPPWFAAITDKLDFVVPLLFLAALAGLYARHRGSPSWLRETGFFLAFSGSGWGVVYGVADMSLWYAYIGGKAWASLLNWLPPLFAGLTLIGVAAVRANALRGWSASTLATGAFGWAYYVTDSGGILEARPGHITFGVLFSLGWVVTGYALWSRGAADPDGRPDGRSRRSAGRRRLPGRYGL